MEASVLFTQTIAAFDRRTVTDNRFGVKVPALVSCISLICLGELGTLILQRPTLLVRIRSDDVAFLKSPPREYIDEITFRLSAASRFDVLRRVPFTTRFG